MQTVLGMPAGPAFIAADHTGRPRFGSLPEMIKTTSSTESAGAIGAETGNPSATGLKKATEFVTA
jgi:hypothetical protein